MSRRRRHEGWPVRASRRCGFAPVIPCAILVLFLWPAQQSFAAEKQPNLPKQVQEAVKQAALLLDQIDQALDANQFQNVQAGLQKYQTILDKCIQDTQEYQKTHKKTPRQFKDAEIKVRQQLRRLEDLRPGLPLPLRPEIDKAIERAKRLRHLFLRELFNITPPASYPPKSITKHED